MIRDIILNAPEVQSSTFVLAKKNFTENEFEDFLERASIMEYDGKMKRGYSETVALFEVMNKRKSLAGNN